MMRRSRGFAVVEILVVVAIGAILLGGLLWQVRPLADRLALRSAASRLVGHLRGAQARALAERDAGRAHGAEFPADGRRYLLVVQTAAGRETVREERLHPRVRITYARFGGVPERVTFGGTSLLGAPSGGGTVTFTAGGAVLCVRVLPATGRVRVDEVGCP